MATWYLEAFDAGKVGPFARWILASKAEGVQLIAQHDASLRRHHRGMRWRLATFSTPDRFGAADNPLSRSETAAVLAEARDLQSRARVLVGRPSSLVYLGKAQGLRDVARTFGQAGGAAGRRYRMARQFGAPAPGDPDYIGNPSRSPLTWHTTAGGTGAAEGKHGYTAHPPEGDFHIWAVTNRWGRHAGYVVNYADTAGRLGGGLWHRLGGFRSPAAAKQAARAFYETRVLRRGNPTQTPRGAVYAAGVAAGREAFSLIETMRGRGDAPWSAALLKSRAWEFHRTTKGLWGVPEERAAFEAGFMEGFSRGNPRKRPASAPATFGRSKAVKVRDVDPGSEEARGLPWFSPSASSYGRRGRQGVFVVTVPGREGERLVYDAGPVQPGFVMPAAERRPIPKPTTMRETAAESWRRALALPARTIVHKTEPCPRCGKATSHQLGETYKVCEECGKISLRNALARLGRFGPRYARFWVIFDKTAPRYYRGWSVVHQVDRPRATVRFAVLGPFDSAGEAEAAGAQYADAFARPNPLDRRESAALLTAARRAHDEMRAEFQVSHPATAQYFRGLRDGLARAVDTHGTRTRRVGKLGRNPLTREETAQVLRHVARYRRTAKRHAREARALPPGIFQSAEWRLARDLEMKAAEASLIAHLWGEAKRAFAPGFPRPTRNPPARVLGPIPGTMQEIRYRRTGKDAGPYYHKFGPNVRAYALADGAVLLRGPRRLFCSQ